MARFYAYVESKNAIKNFEKYILKGIGIETEFNFKSGDIEEVVGNRAFIEEVMTKTCAVKHKKIELADLIKKVCEIHEITPE